MQDYQNLFETWLKDCLVPKLERGDIIIIIDNASFHKGEYIREIIESAGCEIWYLPPYSPDLNNPLLSVSAVNNLGWLYPKTFTKNLDFSHSLRK